MITGPTGSGKTRLLGDLIRQATAIASPPPKEIIYCYSIYQDYFDEIATNSPVSITFVKGLPKIQDSSSDRSNKWIILDDLMKEVLASKDSDNLFTRQSHHLNLTVFFVTQNPFLKEMRTISTNSQYFFIGKNPRDGTIAVNLAKQMTPGNTRFFAEAYADATKAPHSFLLVSARQETPDSARLIANYARPGKRMMAYVPA